MKKRNSALISEPRDINWYKNKVANVPKYASISWKTKVYAMQPRQVIAIYKKFKKDGLFDKNWKPKEEEKVNQDYYQFTIFDFM